MLRIAVCCLGGGSSFFVTHHLMQEVRAHDFGDRADFKFMAFARSRRTRTASTSP